MNRNLALGIAGGALALTVAAGGVFAGTAGAAPATQATATATAAPSTTTKTERRAGRYDHGLIQTAVAYFGLTREQIASELRSGKSLAQIAQAQNKDINELITQARANLNTRLTTAVSSGKITQAQAATALATFDANAQTVVNSTTLGNIGGRGGKGNHGVGRAALVEATASVSGLTVEQVRTELQAGKTFAQIAQEKGKTVDDIIAKLRELGEQRLASELQKARDALTSPVATPAPTAAAN